MARYKVLKSVAHSLAHSFTSLMNYRGGDYVMGHLLRSARETGNPRLAVDLISGKADPPALLTQELREAVERYTDWFPGLVRSHHSGMEFIRSAIMTVTFDLSAKRSMSHAPQGEEFPFTCRVEIVDDRGKLWTAEISDWWYPESGELTGSTPHPGRTGIIQRLGQLIRSVGYRSSDR